MASSTESRGGCERPAESAATVVLRLRILTTALPLIERRGLTLVGVTVAELENADTVQLRLPVEAHGSALDAALDAVRERFGSKAITRAVLVGRAEGLSPPLLPD
jgi:DNA polymerase IV